MVGESGTVTGGEVEVGVDGSGGTVGSVGRVRWHITRASPKG